MLHDIDITMGQNLRGLRAVRGLSQAELGAKCEDGLSAQQISKYELGDNQISCSRLVEFARIMGCNILDFFKGVKAP
jgi:transcriptional regulator with XRE-family HTH domain